MEKQIDPIYWPLNHRLNFLSFLFKSGYQYRAIACHRSATSAFHDQIDYLQIGEHPQVSSLVGGVFNKRQPQPRNSSI